MGEILNKMTINQTLFIMLMLCVFISVSSVLFFNWLRPLPPSVVLYNTVEEARSRTEYLYAGMRMEGRRLARQENVPTRPKIPADVFKLCDRNKNRIIDGDTDEPFCVHATIEAGKMHVDLDNKEFRPCLIYPYTVKGAWGKNAVMFHHSEFGVKTQPLSVDYGQKQELKCLHRDWGFFPTFAVNRGRMTHGQVFTLTCGKHGVLEDEHHYACLSYFNTLWEYPSVRMSFWFSLVIICLILKATMFYIPVSGEGVTLPKNYYLHRGGLYDVRIQVAGERKHLLYARTQWSAALYNFAGVVLYRCYFPTCWLKFHPVIFRYSVSVLFALCLFVVGYMLPFCFLFMYFGLLWNFPKEWFPSLSDSTWLYYFFGAVSFSPTLLRHVTTPVMVWIPGGVMFGILHKVYKFFFPTKRAKTGIRPKAKAKAKARAERYADEGHDNADHAAGYCDYGDHEE